MSRELDPCHNPDFCKLCRAADRAARRRNAHDDPKLERLRRLLDDDVSLERAYVVLNGAAEAPAVTVEALMYGLRERGTKALAEPDTKRRLAALSDEQIVEVQSVIETKTRNGSRLVRGGSQGFISSEG
jgi:hypothetical protein